MRDDRGQALVEFSLVILIFMTVVAGFWGFAPLWNKNNALDAAVREATRAASSCRFYVDLPTAKADAKAKFDAVALPQMPDFYGPGGSPGAGSLDIELGTCNPGGTVTVDATYTWHVAILGLKFYTGELKSDSVSSAQ